MYDLFSAEADACLAQGLIVPAHDYVLKCSHCFNILDTRGAISVAERQAFFRRIRELAKGVAVSYGEQRKGLEYPLLKNTVKRWKAEGRRLLTFLHPAISLLPSLLEIGVEELPASDVDIAYAAVSTRVPTLLKELNLTHGDIRIFTDPSAGSLFLRLSLPESSQIAKTSSKVPPLIKPSTKTANPTQAALGFAKEK